MKLRRRLCFGYSFDRPFIRSVAPFLTTTRPVTDQNPFHFLRISSSILRFFVWTSASFQRAQNILTFENPRSYKIPATPIKRSQSATVFLQVFFQTLFKFPVIMTNGLSRSRFLMAYWIPLTRPDEMQSPDRNK